MEEVSFWDCRCLCAYPGSSSIRCNPAPFLHTGEDSADDCKTRIETVTFNGYGMPGSCGDKASVTSYASTEGIGGKGGSDLPVLCI